MKIRISLIYVGFILILLVCVDTQTGIPADEIQAKSLIERMTMRDIAMGKEEAIVTTASAKAVKTSLWNKYCQEILADATRKREMKDKVISFNGQRMRFFYRKIGKTPDEGYPLYIALHGGGGAPATVNDSQWNHMKTYYRNSVTSGIYVATRGISNEWNLHFMQESYVMYDRLIENMIVFENVDPNKIYLLGFSAGGDGVYQIAPRMPDRFAAANMSAGHPNGVSPKNLYRLPFLIQIGANDRAYNRNQEAVKYKLQLDALQEKNADGYDHELFVHAGRAHNFEDNDPGRNEYDIIANTKAWLENSKEDRISKNTNAIDWLAAFRRNPLPNKVIWDIATEANRSGKSSKDPLWESNSRGCQRYWLEIPSEAARVGEIIARIDKDANMVAIEKAIESFTILLNSEMLNLEKQVRVSIDGNDFSVKVKGCLKNMASTLLDRGDFHYVFEGKISIKKTEKGWNVE